MALGMVMQLLLEGRLSKQPSVAPRWCRTSAGFEQLAVPLRLQVAFGTVTQLVLEGRPHEELDTVYKFCLSVGLPVTLGQVGTSQ